MSQGAGTIMPYFAGDAGGAPNSAERSIGVGQIPGLPHVNIPAVDDLLAAMSSMQLPKLGVFTPWAEQSGELAWTEIPKSVVDTNIVAWPWQVVQTVLQTMNYGDPGFVAVIAPSPVSLDHAATSFRGTPFRLFGGQGVYSQADSTGIPAINFLYWFTKRDSGDPEGGSASAETAAQALGGILAFAQQVPVESTTFRDHPTVPFQQALEMQFPNVSPPPQVMCPGGMVSAPGGCQCPSGKVQTSPGVCQDAPPMPPSNGQPAAAKADMTKPALIFGGVALLTFLAAFAAKKGKR